MKEYGIGYAIFEWDGTRKQQIKILRGKPGNIKDAMKSLETRIQKLNKDHKILDLMITSMFWGFAVRLIS